MPFPIGQLELLDPVSGRKLYPGRNVSEKFRERQAARGKLSGLSHPEPARETQCRERRGGPANAGPSGWSCAAQVAASVGVSASNGRKSYTPGQGSGPPKQSAPTPSPCRGGNGSCRLLIPVSITATAITFDTGIDNCKPLDRLTPGSRPNPALAPDVARIGPFGYIWQQRCFRPRDAPVLFPPPPSPPPLSAAHVRKLLRKP